MSEQQQAEPSGGYVDVLGEHASNPPEGRTTGEKFHALGREWTVSDDEMRIKAQFETEIRKRANAVIQETMQDGDVEEADRLRSVLITDRAAGYYNWDGRYCTQARRDIWGLRYLLLLCLRRCRGQENTTMEQVVAMQRENPLNVSTALNWAFRGNSQTPPTNGEAEGATNGRTASTPTTERALSPEEWAMVTAGRRSKEPTTMSSNPR